MFSTIKKSHTMHIAYLELHFPSLFWDSPLFGSSLLSSFPLSLNPVSPFVLISSSLVFPSFSMVCFSVGTAQEAIPPFCNAWSWEDRECWEIWPELVSLDPGIESTFDWGDIANLSIDCRKWFTSGSWWSFSNRFAFLAWFRFKSMLFNSLVSVKESLICQYQIKKLLMEQAGV